LTLFAYGFVVKKAAWISIASERGCSVSLPLTICQEQDTTHLCGGHVDNGD